MPLPFDVLRIGYTLSWLSGITEREAGDKGFLKDGITDA